MDFWLDSFKDKIIILNKTRLGPVVTNVTKGLCRVKLNMIILCFNEGGTRGGIVAWMEGSSTNNKNENKYNNGNTNLPYILDHEISTKQNICDVLGLFRPQTRVTILIRWIIWYMFNRKQIGELCKGAV